LIVLSSSLALGADEATTWKPDIPKVWDEAALSEWATPLAGLNARPSHLSEFEYYRLPEDLRSYPVYYQRREPTGYWDMVQRIGPTPLIEPQKLKTGGQSPLPGGMTVAQASRPAHLVCK
jgi:hypothetical protein